MVRHAAAIMTGIATLPLTYSGEIARRVRDARESRSPLRVVGAGTWTAGGAPVDATETVSCASHRDVVDYVPGDLTITVGAGMSLARLAEITAEHDQWLTLDPF